MSKNNVLLFYELPEPVKRDVLDFSCPNCRYGDSDFGPTECNDPEYQSRHNCGCRLNSVNFHPEGIGCVDKGRLLKIYREHGYKT